MNYPDVTVFADTPEGRAATVAFYEKLGYVIAPPTANPRAGDGLVMVYKGKDEKVNA